jgi:hypothetical protein
MSLPPGSVSDARWTKDDPDDSENCNQQDVYMHDYEMCIYTVARLGSPLKMERNHV